MISLAAKLIAKTELDVLQDAYGNISLIINWILFFYFIHSNIKNAAWMQRSRYNASYYKVLYIFY